MTILKVRRGLAVQSVARGLAAGLSKFGPLLTDAREHLYCTISAGSGLAVLCVREFQAALVEVAGAPGGNHRHHSFRHVFDWESSKERRAFSLALLGGAEGPSYCSFSTPLQGGCKCGTHNQVCDVPHVDGAFIGLSGRKDLMGKHTAFADMVLSFVCHRAPSWIVAEDTDALGDEQEISNGTRAFVEYLRGAGYAAHTLIVDTAEFGLPQARRRVYVVAVLRCGAADLVQRPVAEVWAKFGCYVKQCQRIPPSVANVVLASKDKVVVEHAKTLSEGDAHTKVMKPSEVDAHRKTLATVNLLRGDLALVPHGTGPTWISRREAEVLVYVEALCCAGGLCAGGLAISGADVSVVDIGQPIDRQVFLAGASPPVTASSRMWYRAQQSGDNEEEKRFLTPFELLMLQGWPLRGGRDKVTDVVKQSPGTTLVDVAAKCPSGTTLVAVFGSLMAAVEWKRWNDAPSTPDATPSADDLAAMFAGA